MNKKIIEQIIIEIIRAKTIILFPHISVDGDSLGSSVALCGALRKMGKEAHILMEDEIPEYLTFLDDENFCTENMELVSHPDLCIAIDCSDETRFPLRKDLFYAGKVKITIDHHITNNLVSDINYIDPQAAATGELVFYLIEYMKIAFDQRMAEAVYVAISKDTGNFQYTNTKGETHLIAAKLFDYGLDLQKITIKLYQSVPIEKIYLGNEIMGTLELFSSNRACIAYLSQEMLEKTGATKDQSEGIIETMRSINGIEVAAFLKENPEGDIKVSLRSKSYFDVASLCSKFQGGGHKRAAGFTLNLTMDQALQTVKEEICARME